MRAITKPFALLVAAWMCGVWMPSAAIASDRSSFSRPTLVFGEPAADAVETTGAPNVWQLDFGAQPPAPSTAPAAALDLSTVSAVASDPDDQGPVRRPVAFTYSDGYATRLKIHKYASFLTLPLFGAQYLLGQKLDEGGASETVRASHAAIATTMVGLFAVNTVTGVWNAWEGRKDPASHTRRLIHSVLMLASDAGFVATGLLAPTNDGGGNQSLHKSVAITSIGVATAGYLLMLFGQ